MKITNAFDAIQYGTFEDFLEFYNGDINQIDKYSDLNLLGMAVVDAKQAEEKIKIIDYLIKQRIDVNYVEKKYSRNALHQFFFSVTMADKDYILKITRKLVEAGIDINAKDKYNAIPLKYAITVNKLETEDMEKVYRYLIKNGSDYEHRDSFDKSCLDYANEYSWRTGFTDIVNDMKNDKNSRMEKSGQHNLWGRIVKNWKKS